MIPKIIHYCWFGNKPKPEILKQCIVSWVQFCPDYKIIEWNESSFNLPKNDFYKNALRKKKYAFVSDYVRSVVLHKYGGVYLDTDMLIIKSIDELLEYDFFTGFEVDARPAYGFFGGIENHRFLEEMISFYNQNEFNEFSLPVITHTFKDIIKEENLNHTEKIFPIDYFYPLSYENKNENWQSHITKNTFAVHLWNHSWEKELKQNIWYYLKGLKTVLVDYLFYGYSKAYFVRYFRGFSRQIYYKLIGK